MVVTSKWQQKIILKIRQNLFSNQDFRYYPCTCRSLSFFLFVSSAYSCFRKSDLAVKEVQPTMQAELALPPLLQALSPAECPRSLFQPGEADGFTLQGLMLERSKEIFAKHPVMNLNHLAGWKPLAVELFYCLFFTSVDGFICTRILRKKINTPSQCIYEKIDYSICNGKFCNIKFSSHSIALTAFCWTSENSGVLIGTDRQILLPHLLSCLLRSDMKSAISVPPICEMCFPAIGSC